VRGTVFPDLLPEDADWTTQLDTLTPVEPGPQSGRFYKREDMFAPLGYGGVNGSKLRQLIWLASNFNGAPGVITACSVLSPQAPMAAIVARHFGQRCTVVYGGTSARTAFRHENARIARRAGARFRWAPVGYNPALQAYCRDLSLTERPDDWVLHYGITTAPEDADWEIEAFHRVGSHQAANIPPEVRTLVIPAGSCNSVASVLYGLARYGAGALSRVVLVGIGPSRVLWLRDRLHRIEKQTGRDITGLFTWRMHDGPEVPAGSGPVLLEHYDLHTTGQVRYSDRRPWRADGIEFHPTYEGKVMSWLEGYGPYWWTRPADGTVLFWIIGSEPREKAMEGLL
jgi:hypothetical protein